MSDHAAFRAPVLPHGTALVWRVDVGASIVGDERALPLLSADETERAHRFLSADHRRRFVRSHVALRQILGGILGLDPAAVQFAHRPHGKPYLPEPQQAWLQFNLSHSAELAVVACCRDDEIGIDVEHLGDSVNSAELARTVFSAEELAAWWKEPTMTQRRHFFQTWARKEAYTKALGIGLMHDFSGYHVECDTASCMRIRGDATYHLFDIDVGTGYAAALATRSNTTPEVREFSFFSP